MVLNNNPNNINLSRIKRDTHSCDDIVDHCNNNGNNDNNINQIRNPYAKISLEKLNSSRNCFVLGANNTPPPPSLPPPLPGPPPALPTVSRKISIKKCKFFFYVTLPKTYKKAFISLYDTIFLFPVTTWLPTSATELSSPFNLLWPTLPSNPASLQWSNWIVFYIWCNLQ